MMQDGQIVAAMSGDHIDHRPILRKDDQAKTPEDWLVGKLVLDMLPKLGSQLPNRGEVLRHFLFLRRGPMQAHSKDHVIKNVIEKVEAFWEQAGIPTTNVKSGHSNVKLTKLITMYDNVRKHKTRKNFAEERDNFTKSLALLFDIAQRMPSISSNMIPAEQRE